MPQKLFMRISMIARIVVWVLVVAVLLFGRELVSGHYFPCMWYENFGWYCSTCGASRAVVSLLAGDFSAAVAYNPVVTIGLVPGFGFLLLSDLAVMVCNLFGKKRRLSPFEYCFSVFGATFRPYSEKGEGTK